MKTHQIHVSGARERVHEIRRELFAFSEVLDVFVTGRADVLVVVYAGRPRPGEWLRVLRRRDALPPRRTEEVSRDGGTRPPASGV